MFVAVGAVATLILAFIAYFYRNPKRLLPLRPGYVAPADGLIVAVGDAYEPDFLRGRAVRISTFMSIFDVHVNRSPMAGEVAFLLRRSGTHLPVNQRSSPRENECHLMGLVNGDVRILVTQVAGPLARRIDCKPKLGEWLERGQPFGRVLLGSRVDVFLPLGIRVLVSAGDRVRAGETILADA